MPSEVKNPLVKLQSLLTDEAIRNELGLQQMQMQEFREHMGILRDKFKGQIAELQKKKPDDIKQLRPQLFKSMATEAEEALQDILDEDQFKRFKQLEIQMQGVKAFGNRELREQLAMTQDQLVQLKEIVQGGADGAIAGVDDDEDAAAQGASVARITALLSPEQLETWHAIRGEEFDFGQEDSASAGPVRHEYQPGEEEREAQHDFDLGLLEPLVPEQKYFAVKFLFRGAGKPYEAPALSCFQNPAMATSQSQLVELIKFYVESGTPSCEPHPPETYREMLSRLSAADSGGELTTGIYSCYTQLLSDSWWTFMNYGYYDPFTPLDDSNWTETEKLWPDAVALYLKTINQVEVEGKDLIEIGCGRGGGSAFIARHLKPNSVTAIDATGSNVLFSQKTHDVEGLRYCYGDAWNVPRPDNSADIVMTVESFNYYRPYGAFISEVDRVLRPGGKLLVTGWAQYKLFKKLIDTAKAGGYSMTSSTNVTEGAALAIQRFNPAALVAGLETVRPKWLYVDMWRRVRRDLSTIDDGSTPYMTMVFEKTR